MKKILIMDMGSMDLTKVRLNSVIKKTIMAIDTARGVHGVIGGASKASYQLYSHFKGQRGIKVEFLANFSKFTKDKSMDMKGAMEKNYDLILLNSMKDVLFVDEYIKSHKKTKTLYTDRANAIINRRYELGFHPRKVPMNYLFHEMRKWLDIYVGITPEQTWEAKEFFTKSKVLYIPIAPDKIYKKIKLKKTFLGGIYVGRLDERQKKVGFLLEGIAKVKKFNPKLANKQLLKIVGEGPDERRYEELAGSLGIKKNVIFEGPIFGDKLVREYNNAGFFVSTSEWESPGRSFIEAMACGLPLLVNTKNNTMINPATQDRLTMSNYNGLIYEYGNIDDFVDKFHFMFTNRHFLERAGRNALKYSKNFSLEKTLSKYDKIVRSG